MAQLLLGAVDAQRLHQRRVLWGFMAFFLLLPVNAGGRAAWALRFGPSEDDCFTFRDVTRPSACADFYAVQNLKLVVVVAVAVAVGVLVALLVGAAIGRSAARLTRLFTDEAGRIVWAYPVDLRIGVAGLPLRKIAVLLVRTDDGREHRLRVPAGRMRELIDELRLLAPNASLGYTSENRAQLELR